MLVLLCEVPPSIENAASKYCTLRRHSEIQLGTFSNPQYRPGVVVLRRQISDKGTLNEKENTFNIVCKNKHMRCTG